MHGQSSYGHSILAKAAIPKKKFFSFVSFSFSFSFFLFVCGQNPLFVFIQSCRNTYLGGDRLIVAVTTPTAVRALGGVAVRLIVLRSRSE